LLFLKKGQLFYFHVPRQVSKIKQGKKMSGLGIWTIGQSFLQKLSAGCVFYIINLNVEVWVLFSLSGNIVETPFSAGCKAAPLGKIFMYLVI